MQLRLSIDSDFWVMTQSEPVATFQRNRMPPSLKPKCSCEVNNRLDSQKLPSFYGTAKLIILFTKAKSGPYTELV